MNTNTVGVYYGRFQPLHKGHTQIIEEMAANNKMNVVFVGCTGAGYTHKNPYDYVAIKAWIEAFLYQNKINNVIVAPLADNPSDDQAWLENLVEHSRLMLGDYAIGSKVNLYYGSKSDSVSFIEQNRDFFTRMWWNLVSVAMIHPVGYEKDSIDATDIRNFLFQTMKVEDGGVIKFEDNSLDWLKCVMDPYTIKLVATYMQWNVNRSISCQKSYYADIKHKDLWKNSPYPPTFVCGDKMYIDASGRVLLTQRKGEVGHGQWSLQGGYFDGRFDYSLKDTAHRESLEELGVSYNNILIQGHKMIDWKRGLTRGFIATRLEWCKLTSNPPAPTTFCKEEVLHAQWFTPEEIRTLSDCGLIFEDHFTLIHIALSEVHKGL